MSDQTPAWLEELRAIGRDLPGRTPERGRAEAVRTSLLLAAEASRQARTQVWRRPAVWLCAALVSGCAVWFFVLYATPAHDPGSKPAHRVEAASLEADDSGRRASIETSLAADFEHTSAVRGQSRVYDEVVRLRAGRVKVAVAELRPRERFRVIASNAEVEVRGTSFEVEVHDDQLTEVVVISGLVEVRIEGRPAMLLAAGARWSVGGHTTQVAERRAQKSAESALSSERSPTRTPAPAQPVRGSHLSSSPTADLASPARPAPAGMPRPRPARRSSQTIGGTEPVAAAAEEQAPIPAVDENEQPDARTAPSSIDQPASDGTRPPVEATVTERAFETGWSSLRNGDYGSAADAFARAVSAAPDAPLAEDARYWRAVALARAGRTTAAARAMARFLKHHPGSSRAGEVSVMLGWLRLDAGDLRAARSRFQAGMGARDAQVQTAARQGLGAVRRAEAPSSAAE